MEEGVLMDIPSLISIYEHLPLIKEGVIFFMGEAIISRGGGTGSSGSSEENSNFRTEIVTASTLWKVPENLKDGTVSVRIFGGGMCGYESSNSGGGGGCMNNNIINISNESEIYITIGRGANPDGILSNRTVSGGTTSFGTYLSALGATDLIAGSGGGSASICVIQFGGGGGYYCNDKSYGHSGGTSGGKWGGGGGGTTFFSRGGCLRENSQNIYEVTGYSGLAGNGGYIEYSNINNFGNAENGINTIGMNLDFEGMGLAGNDGGGGGGYGGNGGNNCCGGGGGYGSDGGNGYIDKSSYSINKAYGGGGGGYGGKGGDAWNRGNGGGGGYGKYGYGGGYDIINNCIREAGIAAGGAFGSFGNNYIAGKGGDGICIIQYYVK